MSVNIVHYLQQTIMKIVGHRGARGLAPENTIASIRKALDCGVDEIEIDVRVTKDGKVVLAHDQTIGWGGKFLIIAASTYDELRTLKPDLTLLSEAITTIDRKVPLMIEVKPRVATDPVIAIVQDFLAKGWRQADFMFGSFHQPTLRTLHAALPVIETVVIERFSSMYAQYRARQLHAKRVSLNYFFLPPRRVARLKKRGFIVYIYSLNQPKRAALWAKHGLDGVITDRPDLYTTK